jgi:hypothetical protein
MPARLGNITFDCDDVLKVATFWSGVLGRTMDAGSSDYFASIGNTDPQRKEPAWYFSKVPETKTAKNREHVDLVDPDPGAVARLVSMGAVVIDEQQLGTHHWTVLQDPEGNEFCIAAQSWVG